ncbi:unnamed protein product, partial [Meganyctiphanes norvegica]
SDTFEELDSTRKKCGMNNHIHIESKGNSLFIHFKTDGSVSFRGFKLRWRTLRKNYNNEPCEDLSKDCLLYVKRGFCVKYNSFMEKYCKSSCKLCKLEGSMKNPPTGNICGISPSMKRIVGGSDVQPIHKYPWQVGLREFPYAYHCGGSIISSDYILTAAHCFY